MEVGRGVGARPALRRVEELVREAVELKEERAMYQERLGVAACARCGVGKGFGGALDVNELCGPCGAGPGDE